MQTETYRYNDADNLMALFMQNFTSRIGDGSGNAEENYLSIIKLIADCKPNAKVLDIGCGLGRMIQLFQESAGSVVGLEPDRVRAQKSQESFHDIDRIRIINTTSLEYKLAYPRDRFDVIIVSMVLQHVATAVCRQILRDVNDLLSPTGVAIIATTQQHDERFTRQSDHSAMAVEDFDRYATDTANQPQGVPVRYFSKTSFHAALVQAGLRVIDWGQFAYIRPDRLDWYAAMTKLAPEAVKDVAISQYAVVKLTRVAEQTRSLFSRLLRR